MSNEQDIAAKRFAAEQFRESARKCDDQRNDLHTSIVETIVTLRTGDASREELIDRLMSIDTLASGALEMAAIVCRGVAGLHDEQAERKERGAE